MIPYQLVWLIMLLPLFSFIINGLIIRPFVKKESKTYGYITITAIGVSAIFSIWALISLMSAEHHELPVPDVSWMVIGNFNFHVGMIADQLSIIMAVVVSVVSLMVQIYSLGYMKHDEAGYYRYYTYMSLFTFSMLGLVLSDNLLFTFVFWEMVGLCSYLLIGFWYHRKSAADAAKKAFIVTRIGDFGFLAGILILFFNTGTFDIHHLHELAVAGVLGGTVLMWAAIGAAGMFVEIVLATGRDAVVRGEGIIGLEVPSTMAFRRAPGQPGSSLPGSPSRARATLRTQRW